ncbi:hypothetical protein [Chryseobacterium sp.]|uniref:hypothetical protein n=1 Tax=Chryseobacterium sp. TaxID=1871047 RepID=UPI0026138CF3|nr:hypothetical protein [Chryseobacterium sp.]
MKKYYVNKRAQSNGDHEECRYIPDPANRKYLGEYSSCNNTVRESKKTDSQSNGCKTCSHECHTS